MAYPHPLPKDGSYLSCSCKCSGHTPLNLPKSDNYNIWLMLSKAYVKIWSFPCRKLWCQATPKGRHSQLHDQLLCHLAQNFKLSPLKTHTCQKLGLFLQFDPKYAHERQKLQHGSEKIPRFHQNGDTWHAATVCLLCGSLFYEYVTLSWNVVLVGETQIWLVDHGCHFADTN